MSEKPFEIKWALENARKAVDTLEKGYEHLSKVANATSGKIMPVTLCSRMMNFPSSVSDFENRGGFYSSPSTSATVKKATEALEAAIAEDRKTHETNLPAIENNIRLRDSISLLMVNAGIPESYTEYGWNARRTKRTEEKKLSGWYKDLQRLCICVDRIADSEKYYADYLKKISEYKTKKDSEEAAKKAELEKIEAAKINAKELAVALVKYDLPAVATWDDVLDAILKKNKYLRLAHYLLKNRNDWNDGPDYARTGIDGFKVETDTDKEIADEISGLISDWDGDGRCFRDCDWNYDRIFGLVNDENLMKEYEEVKSKIVDW